MSVRAPTVVAALADALAADPGRPLVTFYDGSTGERVELSVKSFDNWVCKLANLFSDELMIDPGEVVAVSLPIHWQSCVALAAAWTADLGVTLDPGSAPAARVVGPAALTAPENLTGHVLACSLRPMGGTFTEPLPGGWLDFGAEVPPQPDELVSPPSVRPDDTAVRHGDTAITHAQLVDLGAQAAAASGLEPGGRLLTDLNPADPTGLETALIGPLVTDSSVVLAANMSPQSRLDIATQERVTCSRWATD